MAGPKRTSEWIRRLKSEGLAALRLSPWLLLSLLLVLILWQADTAALAGLFQSPPTDTPTVPTTPTSATTPPIVPTATFTPVPTATLTTVPTATVTPELSATLTPVLPQTPEVSPTLTPTLVPSPTPTVTPTQMLPAGEVSPTLQPAEGEADAAAGQERQRYATGESGLEFEWGMLFDAVALGLSYTWLCCGVFVVLGVPLFFLVLWVASRVRQQRAE